MRADVAAWLAIGVVLALSERLLGEYLWIGALLPIAAWVFAVAFEWPGGILDNWCGIVHNPTGDVVQVNELETGSPQWRSHSMTRLFGGDMLSCLPFEGSYYLCCFT